MKKIYATGLACAALTTLHAQSIENRGDRHKRIDHAAQHNTSVVERSSTTALGNAQNMYTILLSGQNQVSYVPAANSLVFVHRQNSADVGNVGGSGTLRFDYSTDGGSTWSVNTLLSSQLYNAGPAVDSIVGCRYPNVTLYNPSGNTDPANLYAVSTGPTLNTLNAGQWGILQASSAKFDGSNVNDTYFSPWGDNTAFHPYGLQYNADGTLWSMVSRLSTTSDNADEVDYTRFGILKGVFNDVTNTVDWTLQYEMPWQILTYNDPDNGLTGQASSWNLAWAPDGQTGYAVINGAQTDGLGYHPHPYVWKTTDGGDTWNALPTHDFGAEQWVLDNILPTDDGGVASPFFSDMDCTVDANGTLHMISEVVSGYSSTSLDSAGYTFSDILTQFIVHLSTSDGDNWTMQLVSPVFGTDYEFSTPQPPGASQSNRPQASRSADGTKVFFSFNSSGVNETENSFPDMYGCSYSTSNNLWTAVKNLTEGSDAEQAAWFHTVSPISITGGADFDNEIPTVYANPGAQDTDPCGFYYLKGIGFNDNEYTNPAIFALGVEELSADNLVGIFPNPSNGRFTLTLTDLGRVDIIVSDATGRVVRTERTSSVNHVLDLTGEPAGMYTVTVRGAKGQTSRSILLY